MFTLLVVSMHEKPIKYHTAISSKMICNNEKTITEMTTENQKLIKIDKNTLRRCLMES
jgi:hypothetical protein